MEYTPNDQRKEIVFRFDIDDDRVLEQLQFVHLISAKFEGDIPDDRLDRNTSNGRNRGEIVVVFSEFRALLDAKDWCRVNLEDGQVIDRYVGALNYADPDAWLAERYLDTIKGIDPA